MTTAVSTTEPISAFTKDLASSSRPLREAALEKVERLLKNLPSEDVDLRCLQLWKGLYYSMWMADRPKPQQRLAEKLAELPDVVSPQHRITFLRAFWETMISEWTNIDSYRMNKFLYLVRCYLRTTFRLMSASSWTNRDLISAHLSVLSDLPLEPTDPKKPNGLRLHLLDIYIDELERADPSRELPQTQQQQPNETGEGETKEASEQQQQQQQMLVPLLLTPLTKIAKESPTKIIRLRAKEALADERVESLGKTKEGTQKRESVEAESGDGEKKEEEAVERTMKKAKHS